MKIQKFTNWILDDSSEVKTQQKNVSYKKNASFSFNDIIPGNWEVQATLEADYTGEEVMI